MIDIIDVKKAVDDELLKVEVREVMACTPLSKPYVESGDQEMTGDKAKEIQSLRNCSCSCSDGIIDAVEDIIDKYIV